MTLNMRHLLLLAAGSLVACAVEEHQLTTELGVGGGTHVAGATSVGGGGASNAGGSKTTDTSTNVAGATNGGGNTNVAGASNVGGGGNTSTATSTNIAGATNAGGDTNVAGATNAGGVANVGGNTSTGTVTNVGGATDVGGNSNAGGETNAGGSTTAGGTESAGGSSGTDVGGSSSVGGTESVGGDTNVGGDTSTVGGDTSVGGTTANIGGDTSVGGDTNVGGDTSVGGTTANVGGDTSAGGTTNVGGTSSTGGTTAIGPCQAYTGASLTRFCTLTNGAVDFTNICATTCAIGSVHATGSADGLLVTGKIYSSEDPVWEGNPVPNSNTGGQCDGFAAVNPQNLQPYTRMVIGVTNHMTSEQLVRVKLNEPVADPTLVNYTLAAAVRVAPGATVTQSLKWGTGSSSCNGAPDCTDFVPTCILETGTFDPAHLATIGLYVGDAATSYPIDNVNIEITTISFE
jgi:hypothetical protein